MGERFSVRRLIVPLLTISRKNTRVENELICVVNDLLGGLGRGASVGVCNCVIDLPSDNLDGVGGGVCLTEALVVREPVGVGYDSLGLVQLFEKIQAPGSALPLVWPVFDPHKVVLDGAQKLLNKGAVYVLKGVERQCGRVVSVADGRCFRSSGACRYDGRCSGIGRGGYLCCREGCKDGG